MNLMNTDQFINFPYQPSYISYESYYQALCYTVLMHVKNFFLGISYMVPMYACIIVCTYVHKCVHIYVWMYACM